MTIGMRFDVSTDEAVAGSTDRYSRHIERRQVLFIVRSPGLSVSLSTEEDGNLLWTEYHWSYQYSVVLDDWYVRPWILR